MVATKPKSIYTVKTGPSSPQEGPSWAIEKWNTDGDLLDTYYITERPFLCTCFAGVKTEPCRHKQILGIFRGDNLVDRGGFYMWDQNPKHRNWYSKPGEGEEDAC